MFNKEADWPIARQDRVRERAKWRMLGRRRSQRNHEQMQRESRWAYHTEKRYQVTWQSIDKKYGLQEAVRVYSG